MSIQLYSILIWISVGGLVMLLFALLACITDNSITILDWMVEKIQKSK